MISEWIVYNRYGNMFCMHLWNYDRYVIGWPVKRVAVMVNPTFREYVKISSVKFNFGSCFPLQ